MSNSNELTAAHYASVRNSFSTQEFEELQNIARKLTLDSNQFSRAVPLFLGQEIDLSDAKDDFVRSHSGIISNLRSKLSDERIEYTLKVLICFSGRVEMMDTMVRYDLHDCDALRLEVLCALHKKIHSEDVKDDHVFHNKCQRVTKESAMRYVVRYAPLVERNADPHHIHEFILEHQRIITIICPELTSHIKRIREITNPKLKIIQQQMLLNYHQANQNLMSGFENATRMGAVSSLVNPVRLTFSGSNLLR